MKRNITLVIVLIAIVGTILYIESGKAKPTGDAGDQDVTIVPPTTTPSDVETATSGGQEVPPIPTSGGDKEVVTTTPPPIQTESGQVLTTEMRIASKKSAFPLAKEISTPDGFINTDPITVQQFIGKKVILVDFWTYSCINCQRTLPYLESWHEKYADKGLVILGIHTPEFEFEKDYDNVKRAVEKWGIMYPVILDNDFSTWRSYENRYWPRKYLIDIDGFIVYDHIGEGGYDETEAKIVQLLNERSRVLGMNEEVEMDTSAPQNVDEVNFLKVRSAETYLGASRVAYHGNLGDCYYYVPCEYVSEGNVTLNTFELDGLWNVQAEYATLEGDGGAIRIRFNANKVNLVAESDEGADAEIYLDGALVTPDNAGYSVTDGVVHFEDSDLYNLIDLQGEYGEHLLEIRFKEGGVKGFAFTFG